MCLLQEEGDLLCLPGGSDTEGQHCDEGRGQRTERDNNREVCTLVYGCVCVSNKSLVCCFRTAGKVKEVSPKLK